MIACDVLRVAMFITHYYLLGKAVRHHCTGKGPTITWGIFWGQISHYYLSLPIGYYLKALRNHCTMVKLKKKFFHQFSTKIYQTLRDEVKTSKDIKNNLFLQIL